MTNRNSKKSGEPGLFPIEEKLGTSLISLLQQLENLIGPLRRLAKVLRSSDAGSEDYPWPEVLSCLVSARKAWETHAESLPRILDKAVAATEELLNQQNSTLQQRFMERITQRGWTVQGDWPEPVVDQVIFVKVDSSRGKAVVNGRSLGSFSLDQLVKAIEIERSALLTKDFDSAKWLDELSRAYDRARAVRGLPDGEAIPVFDILPQIVWARQDGKFFHNPSAQNFLPYSLVQFRADLTRTLASDITQTADGRQLEISSGSFTKDTIFMYFPTTRHLGSCGRIAFSQKAETVPSIGSRDA